MPYAYCPPERATDPNALPNIEVFFYSAAEAVADEAEQLIEAVMDTGQMWDNVKHMRWVLKLAEEEVEGWYYRFGFPGCLPDGDAIGPFDTQAEAECAASSDVAS